MTGAARTHLFSYGTLQKDTVQRALFGRRLSGTKDVLRGYTLSTVEITDRAFLAKGENKLQQTARPSGDEADSIAGMVFEISEEELLLCERYEPESYERSKVVLRSGTEAWLYAASTKA